MRSTNIFVGCLIESLQLRSFAQRIENQLVLKGLEVDERSVVFAGVGVVMRRWVD
jgi:hypothetical protein